MLNTSTVCKLFVVILVALLAPGIFSCSNGSSDTSESSEIPESYYSLTITGTGSGTGAVISDPAGLDCGDVCSVDFEEGAVITLTAIVDEGSIFSGWDGDVSETSQTIQVTMDQDIALTAVFDQEFMETCDCYPLTDTIGDVINVENIAELESAIAQVNASGGDATILLSDGTYQMSGYSFWVTASNLIIRSASGNREDVIIKGMGYEGGVCYNFQLVGSNITLADVTIGEVANHPIQIINESSDNLIHNLRIYNGREQLLKGSTSGPDSENNIVECSLFEFPDGQAYQYYTGGIDVHHGKDWIVRDNEFRDIRSPGGGLAEHAIHFWNNSSGTIVERNIIINCDRGIGFGLGSSGHQGGTIRNNMIYNDGLGVYADVGIGLENADGAEVYNNSVFLEDYWAAIEYRFSGTNAEIFNNLVYPTIEERNGGNATLNANVENAQADWFEDTTSGDLHLADEIPSVVDQGMSITKVIDDFDCEQRPQGAAYDIGADEWTVFSSD